MICVTKVAKSTLDKALAECEQDRDDTLSSSEQPMVAGHSVDLNEPLVEIDQDQDNQQKQTTQLVYSSSPLVNSSSPRAF
ncbi:hypothetical protein TSUD_196320 [Trifolium subterraneum]|nr:hypothetical protein TSUD_196320 [Trifolium subterraneum]